MPVEVPYVDGSRIEVTVRPRVEARRRVTMRCPHCESDQTSLNWLLDQSLRYFCRGCRKTFEVSRGAVQSTARPDRVVPQPSTEGSVQV